MVGKILKKLSKYLALGVLLLPFSTNKILSITTSKHNGNGKGVGKTEETTENEKEKVIDIKYIFSDTANREYVNFIVNNTINQTETGIHPDGVRNRYLNAEDTNNEISSLFQDDKLSNILSLYHPSLDENARKNYLKNFKILIGQDIDYYLESIRKGSWGTTVMSVDRTGKVHFDTISLRSFLVESNPQIDTEILQKLVTEEFFQAHQYDMVIGNLFNNGYLSTIAGINTPESLMKEISIGNMRAFLELFPQQKYLHDTRLGRNSYNYYIGNQLYSQAANLSETVNLPYAILRDFFEEQLGITTQPIDFLNPELIRHFNDEFRSKYLDYYRKQGYQDNQVQIWNLVGMKRENQKSPNNTLDIPALLALPTPLNTLTKLNP